MRPTNHLTEEEFIRRDNALRHKAARLQARHEQEQDRILTQRLDLLVARVRAQKWDKGSVANG